MGDDAMQEYAEDQRAAICYSTFRERSFPPTRKDLEMKLHELKRQRAELVAKMAAYIKQDEERPDGEEMPQEAMDDFSALRATLNALDARIERLEALLAADANSADENGDSGGGGGNGEAMTSTGALVTTGIKGNGGFRVPAIARRIPEEGKGFRLARYIIGCAHLRWNGPEKAAEFIYNRFGDDVVAKQLNIGVVSEGGALIPQDFVSELIELLRANVVMRAAGPMTLQMPYGNLTIPRLAGGSQAAYQGELDDISVTQEQFDDLDLFAKKLTALVPVSNDLIRRAPIGVEAVVRDDLVAGVARREDLAFIRGDGTNKTPIGLRTLVLPANLVTVATGGTLDEVVATLAAMKLTLINGMCRMIRPVWISNASIFQFIATRRDSVGGFYYKDEVERGSLEGYPIYYTQQIPTNLGAGNGSELYLVDMADVVIADTLNVQVDASDVATYNPGSGMVSAFQRDQSLFRIISEHDFNMRHLQSLAVCIPPDWNFAGLPAAPGAPWSTQPLNPSWAQAPSAWPAAATHDPAPVIYDTAAALVAAEAQQPPAGGERGGGSRPAAGGGGDHTPPAAGGGRDDRRR